MPFQPKQKQAFSGQIVRDAQTHFLSALKHHRAGHLEDAVAAYKIAMRSAPGQAEAFLGLAAVLEASGSATQAAVIRKRAARLRPGTIVNCTMLAETLLERKETGAASAVLSLASRYYPDNLRNVALHGLTLLLMGQYEPATGALLLALDMCPNDPAIQTNLAIALMKLGKLEQALEFALKALRIDGDDATTLSAAVTLGSIMFSMMLYAETLAISEFALTLRPGYAEALSNRSLALESLGRFDEAMEAGRQAVAAAPGNHAIRHNLAALLLGQGQLTTEAWDLYESRLLLRGPRTSFKERIWSGEDITGLTIVLYAAEQGLGDTLQFVRYAPLLAGRAGRVILVVQQPLLRLLRQVPGVDQVVGVSGVLPAFDLVCPLMSLPRLLGTTMSSIPTALPYADTYPDWEDDAAGLRVGLAWAGSKEFQFNQQRSIAPTQLEALAAIPGIQFYNLQRDGREALPATVGAIDLMDGVGDFADTAALIAGLDLVVSVDTAVAHLAATMGKPVWLLSRFRGCWRWLQDRSDSPWYPSLRIIRQAQPGDWGSTLEQVRHDLEALAFQNCGLPHGVGAGSLGRAELPIRLPVLES